MRGGALIAVLGAAVLVPRLALAQGEPDNVIDQRVLASAAAAESQQGPLDGAWTVVSADGTAIFAFQIVDKAGGGALEGVWRDLRRPSAPGDIGVIDGLQRTPGVLTISFAASQGAPPTTVSLRQGPDGGWTGDLNEAGSATKVALRRR